MNFRRTCCKCLQRTTRYACSHCGHHACTSCKSVDGYDPYNSATRTRLVRIEDTIDAPREFRRDQQASASILLRRQAE